MWDSHPSALREAHGLNLRSVVATPCGVHGETVPASPPSFRWSCSAAGVSQGKIDPRICGRRWVLSLDAVWIGGAAPFRGKEPLGVAGPRPPWEVDVFTQPWRRWVTTRLSGTRTSLVVEAEQVHKSCFLNIFLFEPQFFRRAYYEVALALIYLGMIASSNQGLLAQQELEVLAFIYTHNLVLQDLIHRMFSLFLSL